MRTIQRKVCLLGDFAVGKTSLVRRFVEGNFDDKYLSTVGVKISRYTIQRAEYAVSLLIWDLAGGDDYKNMGQVYLRGAAGALVVCDLTRPDTLEVLHSYSEQLRSINPQAALVFVANKVDLEDERRISEEELAEVAAQFGAPHILTSAKTGLQVVNAFNLLADQLEVKA